MTWWSTLVSNLRVSACLLMGGCNLMGPAVWSLQSYLITWAALRPWFVFWSQYAQSITKHPIKDMLTGPVTIHNWSFVRNNQCKVFEQLSLHNTIAVISYRNLSSSIMLCNDAACSMEIMWFNTFFINLSTKKCQVRSMLSCGTLYAGQNWLFKQNWVSENCRSETCYQIALAMKGWSGDSWGWRSKCKISVWPVGSRHHPPVINWDGQLYLYLLMRCSNGRSFQIDEAAFWEGLPPVQARASRLKKLGCAWFLHHHLRCEGHH